MIIEIFSGAPDDRLQRTRPTHDASPGHEPNSPVGDRRRASGVAANVYRRPSTRPKLSEPGGLHVGTRSSAR